MALQLQIQARPPEPIAVEGNTNFSKKGDLDGSPFCLVSSVIARSRSDFVGVHGGAPGGGEALVPPAVKPQVRLFKWQSRITTA
jgi:hypothetical protein